MSETQKSPFVILLHAHDSIWRDPGFTLREKLAATRAIWAIVCRGDLGLPQGGESSSS